ncbi:cyclodeaminase/cyclohydrolase family protein [Lentzea terrae]|jgi:methenyltetrahydrofolate cyclohydrolase|uniref:cyclodeaminase/cyclohydrolase family protein n=1 Tax=Lentzea terrae TaxID=2200761 RepID=UPI000DD3DB65|nr:cyclodeaminase/cyclohydrolase family protein [Lentzea terrae]
MRGQTLDDFLTDLAARVPAPGGGATAAVHAAQAAALVAMVARYSDSARFAAHAEEISEILTAADQLRQKALQLAEDDAAAFTAVANAYALPRDAEGRREAIALALKGACGPPVAVIEVAGAIVTLAERLTPIGNRSVITDVAAAAEAARAAATTARVNIEVNLNGSPDPALLTSIRSVDLIVNRAEQVTAAVREELAA